MRFKCDAMEICEEGKDLGKEMSLLSYLNFLSKFSEINDLPFKVFDRCESVDIDSLTDVLGVVVTKDATLGSEFAF